MLEILRPGASARNAKVVLFDFDGTLSLIRAGWVHVMIPMMVEILAELKTGESEADLHAVVEDYVARLTGKETIYQMMEFARQIELRGGTAQDPKVYKKMYLDRLWEVIKDRVHALENGTAAPVEYLVPGSVALLESLAARGLKMYLASGTDHADMYREAELLGLTKYFDGRIFGALDDLKAFSKGLLVQKIVSGAECKGDELLAFGDGYVEIEVVKQAGGVAVGVATLEPECAAVDEWKRKRLAGVGADFIVPNYNGLGELEETLFGRP
ncbi:MAG: HAD family hydrolase [Bryobacter sp.]|jgi:phosphoglycolate phosphatase-like HAD superfamily hydrolase|nr:HAD family hydrolase [Bryobacter sp.]